MKKMTLLELNKNYSFHDSALETITYDKGKKTISMRIDFCTFEQPWFNENSPDVVPISLVFNGVKEYSGITGKFKCYSMLEEEMLGEKTIVFYVMDDMAENPSTEGFYEIQITADSVEFTVLDPTGKEYL
ncbi:MAG: hypothetical protein K5838_05275 [Elusimicrobiales bacterium]|nr:hypothetical protein [Elusimicrobiales bacterium]